MAFVHKATVGEQSIEILYTQYQPGIGWSKKTDFVYAQPRGNWTSLKFYEDHLPRYTDFLQALVQPELEVHRKLAKLVLDEYQFETNQNKYFALECLEILDPTFVSPRMNTACRWQMELVDYMIGPVSLHVTATCRNVKNLKRYFDEMKRGLTAA